MVKSKCSSVITAEAFPDMTSDCIAKGYLGELLFLMSTSAPHFWSMCWVPVLC